MQFKVQLDWVSFKFLPAYTFFFFFAQEVDNVVSDAFRCLSLLLVPSPILALIFTHDACSNVS